MPQWAGRLRLLDSDGSLVSAVSQTPAHERLASGGETADFAPPTPSLVAVSDASGSFRGPPSGELTGPQACLLFGLKSVRGEQDKPGFPALVEALSRASGANCLDAAFSMAEGAAASDLIAAVREGRRGPPPFADAEYFRAIAMWLGCPFDDGAALNAAVRGGRIVGSRLTPDGGVLRYRVGRQGHVAIAPAADWLPGLAAMLCKKPVLRTRMTIAPPHAIANLAEPGGATVINGRIEPLHKVPVDEVADKVVSRWQAVGFAVFLAFAVALSLAAPFVMFVGTTSVVTAILIAYAASRGLALLHHKPQPLPRKPLKTADLPVYTILIPLYREKDGVGELVKSLRRLDYPRDKLDIQFLVEADDFETREAVAEAARDLKSRICIVPEGLPRTKPRALNAGLRHARGHLLAIFDAEDRPDPAQLRVAAETFAAAPPDLAAVQARLCIDHLGDNWLTKMFAIEYACQFDRMLPMIAGRGRMYLLGGTSNHFRTDALLDIGGWDPFNVTEDADLAIRLRRRGYRLSVIESDTYEEAPLTVDAWLKQRSRWFKGYMQTWLVHNREPVKLLKEAGWADTLVIHLYIIGAVTAALAHNVMMTLLLLAVVGLFPLFGGQSLWFIVPQIAAAMASYGVNFALGAQSIRGRGGQPINMLSVLWFPFYWLLMGWAAILATYDLIRRPHHWRKTTHGVAARPSRLRRAAARSLSAAGGKGRKGRFALHR